MRPKPANGDGRQTTGSGDAADDGRVGVERLDTFMARANAAFYAGPDPLSHFTTAPEISQAFGECLGLWAAVTWQQLGSPDPVWLVELGPGRGTLMADAWRAVCAMVPAFAAAARVALVETSPSLRERQRANLATLPARWFDTVEDVPPGPAIVIANEFLDALPIRQFVRRDGGWMERWVKDGGFVELPTDTALPHAPEGSVAEIAQAARAVVAGLAERLAREGGAALILDYGYASGGVASVAPSLAFLPSRFGETLQALRRHAAADPLAAPGQADLTAHVDFAALARAAAPAAVHGPLPMGLVLQRLGLVSRAAMLARSKPSQAGLILSGAQRLVAAEGMGSLFKALCLGQAGRPVPAGFE